jgi:hypothetical protein
MASPLLAQGVRGLPLPARSHATGTPSTVVAAQSAGGSGERAGAWPTGALTALACGAIPGRHSDIIGARLATAGAVPPSQQLTAVVSASTSPTGSSTGAPSSSDGAPSSSGGGGDGDGDWRLGFGNAVKVLRQDLPELFARPLQWDIYRQDIVLRWGCATHPPPPCPALCAGSSRAPVAPAARQPCSPQQCGR